MLIVVFCCFVGLLLQLSISELFSFGAYLGSLCGGFVLLRIVPGIWGAGGVG